MLLEYFIKNSNQLLSKENINLTCNENQIKQLVAILIDNAIEYTEENGDINVTLKKERNDILLNVANKSKHSR